MWYPAVNFSHLGLEPLKILKDNFLSNKAINWSKQAWITNRHPHHNLLQTCGGSESVCPVWIWITDNFLTHPRKHFRINKRWYEQCKKTGQWSTNQRRWIKTQSKILDELYIKVIIITSINWTIVWEIKKSLKESKKMKV